MPQENIKFRILILGADNSTAALLARALEPKSSFQTESISNIEQGLQYFSEFDPHLVLLDVVHPATEKLDVCRRLKSMKAALPVCFLVGFNDIPTQNNIRKAGGDGFITKPLRRAEIRLHVRLLLNAQVHKHSIEHVSVELQQLKQQYQDIIRLITHDIRGPLTILKSNLRFLETSTTSVDRQNLIATCQESTTRLSSMVDNLLLQDQLEIIELKNPSAISVKDHVRKHLDDFNSVFSLRELTIQSQFDSKNLVIWGNKELFDRLVANLLFNAAEHAPSQTCIHVAVKQQGSIVKMTIDDNGVAIPDEFKEQIFDPEALIALKEQKIRIGKGFSLIIARAIVRLHQGQMHIEKPGPTGTRVVVELPIYQ